MKHLIIGSGIVGEATGVFLESHEEKICFHDVNGNVLDVLKQKGYPVLYSKEKLVYDDYDIIWVCTAEWNVGKVLEELDGKAAVGSRIIVRSTTSPGEMEVFSGKYKGFVFAHVPEFLKAKTYIEDVFNPDRIVVGVSDLSFGGFLKDFFCVKYPGKPVLVVSFTESELIKLSSNCWLATQISYWNEILGICKRFGVDPQMVANGCILDSRISSYGTKMIDEPFGGFCLPKDMEQMKNTFERKKMTSEFLKMIANINSKRRR